MKTWKKRPQKLLIISFFMYWPGCPNGPETEIPYHQKSLMQDWLFRLEFYSQWKKNAFWPLFSHPMFSWEVWQKYIPIQVSNYWLQGCLLQCFTQYPWKAKNSQLHSELNSYGNSICKREILTKNRSKRFSSS